MLGRSIVCCLSMAFNTRHAALKEKSNVDLTWQCYNSDFSLINGRYWWLFEKHFYNVVVMRNEIQLIASPRETN